jgi:hypothetical protein
MSTLQETLAEIKKVSAVANTDPSPEPRETLSGRRGRQNRAKETLKELKEQYRRSLLSSAVFVVVTGEQSKEFRDLMAAKASFRSDPEAFYHSLIEDIPTSLFGREGTGSLFDMVGRRLEDAALELGVISYPQMIFTNEFNRKVNTREEFLQLIKKAVNKQVGTELVGLYTVNDILEAAIQRGHKAKFTAIILATQDQEFAVELDQGLNRLTSRVYLVSAGEKQAPGTDFHVPEVSEETVKKVQKTIDASLKR